MMVETEDPTWLADVKLALARRYERLARAAKGEVRQTQLHCLANRFHQEAQTLFRSAWEARRSGGAPTDGPSDPNRVGDTSATSG